jgi:uncharacterized membrane protein YedE/YeeE
MPTTLAALVCGIVFGFGLMVSGMTQPSKVLGFLDVFGRWDPTLAFVMAGALAVTFAGYALARRRPAPVFAASHLWPTKTDIDRPLVAGSALFGAGWGLVGLCPGPAIETLATGSPRVIGFVVAMALAMVAHDLWYAPREARRRGAMEAVLSADG